MINTLIIPSTIFLILIGSFSLYGNENLPYWIKSHRWDLIENEFQKRNPTRETEVYSLVEYHEKAPEGRAEVRFLYLISLMKGRIVSEYNRADIDEILSQPTPHQSVVYRLSFWKLYQELSQRKILTADEKILYLNKIHFDTDPVSRRVFEELGQLYLDSERYADYITKVESLGKEERRYYLKNETWIRYAKSLARQGDLGKAKDEYIALTKDPSTVSYIKNFVYQDLKKYLSDDAFLSLRIQDVMGFINQMKPEDSNHFLSKHRQAFQSRMESALLFEQAGIYLAQKDELNLLSSLVLSNRIYLGGDEDYLSKFSDAIFKNKNYSGVIQFLEKFSDNQEAGKYRVLHLAYEKLGNTSKSYDNLVLYLERYPFNLFYQDKLIDILIQKTGDKPQYAPKVQWKYALDRMPDLPVKGRLLYWYFRYLHDTNQTSELQKELEDYYSKIAGSYYTRVIREEFSSILNEIPIPHNPTENKQALFRYLSHTAGIPEYSGKIMKKNLGFAYFEKSFDLGIRLTNAQSKIRGDRTLSLAVDYFRLGEDSFGMNLIHFYAQEKNLSQNEKEEAIVGVGELSQNHYYLAFYTRSLLKRLQIPDDPILLPTTVSVRIYPRPHRDLVKTYAHEANIPEDVVYAIMRQESFYKENARSRSNAQGLMQVMPATGRELAKSVGVKSYSLFNPKTSIQFGARFLGYLMRSNENELKWASIAYNGGPGNLRKWKKNHFKGDFNHFLEDIPYKESRDYSRIVVSNYYAYEIMRNYHGL